MGSPAVRPGPGPPEEERGREWSWKGTAPRAKAAIREEGACTWDAEGRERGDRRDIEEVFLGWWMRQGEEEGRGTGFMPARGRRVKHGSEGHAPAPGC